MPSIERKSMDRLSQGDRLLVDIGPMAKAGRPIDEKTITLLGKHKVSYVATLTTKYEEKQCITGKKFWLPGITCSTRQRCPGFIALFKNSMISGTSTTPGCLNFEESASCREPDRFRFGFNRFWSMSLSRLRPQEFT